MSIVFQIKSLQTEANTTKGKRLMEQYNCSLDDLCVENIKECFTRIETESSTYFCRIIKIKEDDDVDYDDYERNVFLDNLMFFNGVKFALFEKDYDDRIGSYIRKDGIKYRLQLVQSLTLESVLKRLKRLMEARKMQKIIELKKTFDKELKQKAKQADIEQAKKTKLLIEKERIKQLEKKISQSCKTKISQRKKTKMERTT